MYCYSAIDDDYVVMFLSNFNNLNRPTVDLIAKSSVEAHKTSSAICYLILRSRIDF